MHATTLRIRKYANTHPRYALIDSKHDTSLIKLTSQWTPWALDKTESHPLIKERMNQPTGFIKPVILRNNNIYNMESNKKQTRIRPGTRPCHHSHTHTHSYGKEIPCCQIGCQAKKPLENLQSTKGVNLSDCSGRRQSITARFLPG